MKHIILCSAFVFVFFICAAQGASNRPLVVHEWGTFTSLQDEQGGAIGGINTDDEPVPNFVHRLSYFLLTRQPAGPAAIANQNMYLAKPPVVVTSSGVTMARAYPDVTMRLETPVLYFYPPANWKAQAVDVHVAFPGGWLSEFYPNAVSKAPGFDANNASSVGRIRRDATGELTWGGLTLGGQSGAGPATTEPVWLAPRAVKSAQVTTAGGESEKFLFYRGIGNVDAPLRIARNASGDLEVRDNSCMQVTNIADAQRIHAAWLVDVQPSGACAFKSLGPVQPGTGIRATMPGSFAAKEYSAGNMAGLRAEMRAALVKEGLFADEADALLNTWQVSYFKNPGLRFFYICPRVQIDAALPLQISVPSVITRVMVGRIELVTPQQRALLKDIATGPDGALPPSDAVKKLNQDYFDLGRFRNALILNEQKLRPAAALDAFINRNGLEAFKLDAASTPAAASLSLVCLAAAVATVGMKLFGKSLRKKSRA